jgi:hypothetical protein
MVPVADMFNHRSAAAGGEHIHLEVIGRTAWNIPVEGL